jgi:hypothetical protein
MQPAQGSPKRPKEGQGSEGKDCRPDYSPDTPIPWCRDLTKWLETAPQSLSSIVARVSKSKIIADPSLHNRLYDEIWSIMDDLRGTLRRKSPRPTRKELLVLDRRARTFEDSLPPALQFKFTEEEVDPQYSCELDAIGPSGSSGSVEEGHFWETIKKMKVMEALIIQAQLIVTMVKIHQPFFDRKDLDERALAFHRARLVHYTRMLTLPYPSSPRPALLTPLNVQVGCLHSFVRIYSYETPRNGAV